MAAQKQIGTEQTTGQKRSKNKFKREATHAIEQAPASSAAEPKQMLPAGNAAGGVGHTSEVASLAAPPQSKNRTHEAATAGAPALDGGAGGAPQLKPGSKRSRNKFKQHAEQQATVAPAAVTAADVSGTQNGPALPSTGRAQPLAADAAPTQASAKKRSKNKFKPPSAAPSPPHAAVAGLHASTAAQPHSNGHASERSKPGAAQGGDRVDARQQPAGSSGRLPGGAPGPRARLGSPAGQAGQRSGHRAAAAGQVAGQKRDLKEAGLAEHAAARDKQKKRRRKPKAAAPSREESGASKGAVKTGADGAVIVPTIVAPPPKGAAGQSNWAALKATLGAGSGQRKRRRPAPEGEDAAAPERRPERLSDTEGLTPVLAVDCEMVGVGADGTRSSLARVCVVNSAGNVLLDEHVAQRERVTDYRTRFSGIRPSDLVGAPSLEDVQRRVADMFKGRIVVGHAITNDLTALLLSHPRKSIRDTARFPPLMRATAPGRRPKPHALRHLALEHLGLTIQEGEHSPVDDARAALYLYQKHRKEWELHMERGTVNQLKAPGGVQQQAGVKKGAKSFEELAAADDMVDL